MIAETMGRRGPPSESSPGSSGQVARARRILAERLKYVDHPSFDDPSAPDVILAPSTEAVDDGSPRRSEAPGRPPPLPADRSGATLLSRDQEAHLFRKMNFLKRRANGLREQLDANRPSPGDLDEIERLLSEAAAVKKRIVESNLRLVVSIARTRVGAGYDLPECVSDGNLALIQAVDGFDFARGNKFSTYASWAIRNQLARSRRRSICTLGRSLISYEETLTAPDAGVDEHDRAEIRGRISSAVRRWLGRLDVRERRVLASHYGIDGAPKQTLRQIGKELGISKERVRQIEDRAHAKLRKWARLERLESLPI